MGNSELGLGADHVRYTLDKGIARVVIDRPEKRNALGLQTIAELIDIFRTLQNDASVRAIILTGSGTRVFAAGADLSELPTALDSPENAQNYDARVTPLYEAMQACSKPIIARMAGHAIGGGCLLALACDIRVADESIKVGFPTSRIGLMLSPYEHRLVLRHASLSAAKLLMFTGHRILASEAKALGLIDVVVAPEMLDVTVDRLAERIASGAPLATAAAKSILDATFSGVGLDQKISAAYQSVYTSADLREGLAAIDMKREPQFTGE